ncbi:hypothetical protein P1X15_10005 [Runella sp. MFBS21]|uniref:hypothetical protein n=1 Tax=Runella sp. MFBS21 TaxID=3034018 RepID=UPI0023F99D95|nr:hypothetical protein [Runella sp. MFBS21]MDF7817931.1 hypothetical protein [Runella sp. MFBS21]
MSVSRILRTNPPQPHDAPAVALNGSSITHEQLTELQAQAQKAAELAQQAAKELEEAEKIKQEAAKRQLHREYEIFMTDADNYRQSSRNPDISDAEREKYLRWAAAADSNARQIGIELGIIAPPDAQSETNEDENTAKIRRNKLHRILAAFQVVGLLGILWMTLDAFFFIGNLITQANANVPEGGQSLRPAYDLTSVQKYVYETFTMFADLPRAALLCLLVMPTVVLYIVPIIKSKKDFWTEFFHDLTPWQRALISVITVLGFLLLSVLAHMAKP